MTSRERMTAAFRREAVDRLPCSIYFNANLEVPGYDLRDPLERFRLACDLDTDPVLDVGLPAAPHPQVETRTWRETGEAPTLYKAYRTPAGTLRMGVRATPAWPYGDDIPWSDFSAGHCCEPLIKSPDDIEAFRFLHCPPTGADLDRAAAHIAERKALATKHGVTLRGPAALGLATLVHVMGAENLVLFAVDHPDAFGELARVDHGTNVARIRLLAEAGCDILKRFGGYEQTNFLTPTIFRDVVAPLLRAEVQVAHDAGAFIYYRVVTGARPLLADIAEVGFDCVEGFEPVLSDCANADVRDALGARTCIWTGVSSPGHLGAEDASVARQAVRDAAETFGRRGFILGVTNSIRNHWPWPNTLAMIDEWKRLR
jgi:uroporphyrinogen-III decarboxylase